MADKNTDGYAGDITPREAWKMLQIEENVILVDVRSAAEWTYVGVTDLSSLGAEAAAIEWKSFPHMEENKNFISQVKKICPNSNTIILSLCRSGQRSIASSQALTKSGYKQCYNVLEGFEGDIDSTQHRGNSGGWKFCGLPWKQS